LDWHLFSGAASSSIIIISTNPQARSGWAEVVENRSKQVYPGTGSRMLPYTSYQAVVRFTDQQGQTVIYADKFGFNPPSFRVGQNVRVFYDPQNPQHAIIDRGPKNYVIPLVCGVFGGIMILGSLQRLSKRI
jgi:Protein of unknown function (DUF3592)